MEALVQHAQIQTATIVMLIILFVLHVVQATSQTQLENVVIWINVMIVLLILQFVLPVRLDSD